MRSLARAEVIKSAMVAAGISAVLCAPRLLLWPERKYPLWYLEALLFLGGTVLWAFVFAWHTQYSGRPVFVLKVEKGLVAGVTVAGIVAALLFTMLVDPVMRARTPEDYPTNADEWISRVLFSLAFTQLFLVFAPVAWLMRLFRNKTIAVVLTVVFGLFVMMIKNTKAPNPLPTNLFLILLTLRAASGLLSLYFYLRGGAMLVWWWVLLIHSRHLLNLI